MIDLLPTSDLPNLPVRPAQSPLPPPGGASAVAAADPSPPVPSCRPPPPVDGRWPARSGAAVKPADLALAVPAARMGAGASGLAARLGAAGRRLLGGGSCLGGDAVGNRSGGLQLVAPAALAEAVTAQLAAVPPSVAAQASGPAGDPLGVCPAFVRDLPRTHVQVEGRALASDPAAAGDLLVRLCRQDAAMAHRLSGLMSQEAGNSLMLALASSGAVRLGGQQVLSMGLQSEAGEVGSLQVAVRRHGQRVWVDSRLSARLAQVVVSGKGGPVARPVDRPLLLRLQLSLGPAGQDVRCEAVDLSHAVA